MERIDTMESGDEINVLSFVGVTKQQSHSGEGG